MPTASGEPVAQDDAAALALFDPAHCPPLAFDHAVIIEDYLRFPRDRPANATA